VFDWNHSLEMGTSGALLCARVQPSDSVKSSEFLG
jgi:hypothetical protein